MENNEYVSCKKCQCEITEKEAKRYNKRVNNSVIAMFSYNTCIRNIII